jgi:hypothetical protein
VASEDIVTQGELFWKASETYVRALKARNIEYGDIGNVLYTVTELEIPPVPVNLGIHASKNQVVVVLTHVR